MSNVHLAVVTPDRDVLDIECDEVIAPGVNGEIGLMPGHIPLITALRPGVLTVSKGSKKTYYAVSTGFAEVDHDMVSILTNSCELATDIDLERARNAFGNAETALKTLGPDDDDYANQRRRMALARARLEATERLS